MQRTWNGSAAAPAVGGRIVDFKFSLAAEPADHIDFPAHFGHRHLGAGRGHRAAGGPTADALGKGSSSEQNTAAKVLNPGMSVSSRLGDYYCVENCLGAAEARRMHCVGWANWNFDVQSF